MDAALALFLPTVSERYRDQFQRDVAFYVSRGRSPERACREALASTMFALCRRYSQKMTRHWSACDPDDAYAEGLLAVANSSRLFDPTQGIRFVTYAARAIQRRLQLYRQKASRRGLVDTEGKPVHSMMTASSLPIGSEWAWWLENLAVAPETGVPDWEPEFWDQLIASLPGDRRRDAFAQRFRQGQSYAVIARQYGVHVNAVFQWIRHSLRILYVRTRRGLVKIPGQERFGIPEGIEARPKNSSVTSPSR